MYKLVVVCALVQRAIFFLLAVEWEGQIKNCTRHIYCVNKMKPNTQPYKCIYSGNLAFDCRASAPLSRFLMKKKGRRELTVGDICVH